jgi:RimJ/RimL family protein N-acetyltransferase
MFARTERLLLRPGWIEDAPALTAAISDDAVLNTLALIPSPYREQDAVAWLSRPRDEIDTDCLIFARTNGAPRLVGGIGLKPEGDTQELGYWIARPYWGLGYATEAGRAIVAMAKSSLKLGKLVSGHFIDNPASGHVLRKLGFRPTGRVIARESRARGVTVPCKLYALDFDEDRAAGRMPQMMAA